jgi:rhamnopyranosyl-N-acetylglucosaminyl-diphospho-decaprenol beta-1,3/1,4-galactofuranosyltransferase
MLKVIAVMVTCNRFKLLKEAITALTLQNHPIHKIIVVNNDSKDGTTEWLNEQKDLVVKHQANTGGSGGFFTGIEMAAAYQPDWIWVMDDDTICRPDTLSKLIDKLKLVSEEVGFIGSKSIWTDGTPHLMNIPAIKPSVNGRVPFNKYDDKQLLLVDTSSFVSLMINYKAVKNVGLPYKEFFIWGDDQEYTARITKAGYTGLYCIDSIVLHKTAVNYFPDFYRDTVSNLWKHAYGFRNEFFMVRKNKGIPFFLAWLPIKVAYTILKLLRIRRTDRWLFTKTFCTSALQSIFFSPKIQHV